MEYVAGERMFTFRHLFDSFARLFKWNMRIFITEMVTLAEFHDWWLKDWCTLKIDFAAILSIIFQAVSRSSIIPSTRKQFEGCPMMMIRMISRPTVFKNRRLSATSAQINTIWQYGRAILLCRRHILGLLSLRHTPTLPTYWENFATSCNWHYHYPCATLSQWPYRKFWVLN